MSYLDTQVVSVTALGEVLTAWRKRFEAANPQSNYYLVQRRKPDQNEEARYEHRPMPLTPWQWLAQESGVGIDVIRKLGNGHYHTEWVAFSTADKLITAIGCVDCFDDDGPLAVVRNPKLSAEQYQEWRESQGCF